MKDSKLIKDIAADRMSRLFAMAQARTEEESKESDSLAVRYVSLIRKMSTHYKEKMPRRTRDSICKKCNSVLIPGISCTVRKSSQGYMAYRCRCGTQKRIFIRKSQGHNL